MSDNMGPTPNPDTRHYWDKDLYTHVTYSSYLEPETEDGYTDEQEVLLGQGDTAIYKNHFIVLDSLMVNAGMNEETGQVQRIRLTAAARLINVMGQEFTLRPSYKIEGNQESFEDAVMDSLGYKFRFASVEQGLKSRPGLKPTRRRSLSS
jgi:cytochrome c-type biogenesis protein CcmF